MRFNSQALNYFVVPSHVLASLQVMPDLNDYKKQVMQEEIKALACNWNVRNVDQQRLSWCSCDPNLDNEKGTKKTHLLEEMLTRPTRILSNFIMVGVITSFKEKDVCDASDVFSNTHGNTLVGIMDEEGGKYEAVPLTRNVLTEAIEIIGKLAVDGDIDLSLFRIENNVEWKRGGLEKYFRILQEVIPDGSDYGALDTFFCRNFKAEKAAADKLFPDDVEGERGAKQMKIIVDWIALKTKVMIHIIDGNHRATACRIAMTWNLPEEMSEEGRKLCTKLLGEGNFKKENVLFNLHVPDGLPVPQAMDFFSEICEERH